MATASVGRASASKAGMAHSMDAQEPVGPHMIWSQKRIVPRLGGTHGRLATIAIVCMLQRSQLHEASAPARRWSRSDCANSEDDVIDRGYNCGVKCVQRLVQIIHLCHDATGNP
eukprot:scaffold8732_cov39-Tisochrysis_lutea.AAC.2